MDSPRASGSQKVRHSAQSYDKAYTPKPGSPEREAILQVMKPVIVKNYAGFAPDDPKQIYFDVHFFKVHGDWAYVVAIGNSTDQKWDTGEYVQFLLHKVHGKWIYIDGPDLEQGDLQHFDAHKVMREFRAKHPQAPRDIYDF
jgi:hypothetical protein